METHIYAITTTEITRLDTEILKNAQNNAPTLEQQGWIRQGGIQDKDQIYTINNKPILPRSLYKAAAILSHGQCHVSTGGMVGLINDRYTAQGFQIYADRKSVV